MRQQSSAESVAAHLRKRALDVGSEQQPPVVVDELGDG